MDEEYIKDILKFGNEAEIKELLGDRPRARALKDDSDILDALNYSMQELPPSITIPKPKPAPKPPKPKTLEDKLKEDKADALEWDF